MNILRGTHINGEDLFTAAMIQSYAMQEYGYYRTPDDHGSTHPGSDCNGRFRVVLGNGPFRKNYGIVETIRCSRQPDLKKWLLEKGLLGKSHGKDDVDLYTLDEACAILHMMAKSANVTMPMSNRIDTPEVDIISCPVPVRLESKSLLLKKKRIQKDNKGPSLLGGKKNG